jgi:hypothetical protein
MARPTEEHFFRPSTRRKMPLPAGQLSPQRALSVYSAVEPRYSVPIFAAPVGDALSDGLAEHLMGHLNSLISLISPHNFLSHGASEPSLPSEELNRKDTICARYRGILKLGMSVASLICEFSLVQIKV